MNIFPMQTRNQKVAVMIIFLLIWNSIMISMTFLSLKRGEYKSADYSIINLVGNPVETELRNRVTCYIKSKQQRFHSEYIRSGVVDTNLVAYRAKEIQETLPLFIDNDIYRILMKTSLSSLLPDEFALCFDYKQKVLIDRLSQEEIYIHPYRYNTSQFKSHRYILVYATSMLLNTDYSRNYLQKIFIRSMLYLEKYYPIKFVIFNDDPLTIEYAKQLGLEICTNYKKNEFNVPILPEMIRYLELNFDSEFYGYINGDIIQSSYIYDVLFQLHTLREQKKIPSHVFVAGRRTNLSYETFSLIKNYLEFYDIITRYSAVVGELNPPVGIDYFIATKGFLTSEDMDPIVIGRGYVDNYLMSFASDPTKNAFSVDVTDGVNSIHLCDKEKHKAKQNTKDSDYNVFYYRRRYNIEVSTTIHALKYHLFVDNHNQYDFRQLGVEEKKNLS